MIENETAPPAPAAGPRNTFRAVLRGLAMCCPACGHGRIYRAFLKVADQCPHCRTVLSHHRADDAPPYFTIFIVGHVVVAGVLSLERAYAPSSWVQMAIWVPTTVILSLLVLPRVKGALIGLQWALRMHGFALPSDAATPHRTEVG